MNINNNDRIILECLRTKGYAADIEDRRRGRDSLVSEVSQERER